MSSRDRSDMSETSLRVLAVAEDPVVAKTLEHIVREEGDAFALVTTIDEALARAKDVPFHVAFVELNAAGGAALALCHHLPSVCPGVVVHAIVSALELERGAEALS